MSETILILVLLLKYLFNGYVILGYQSFCLRRIKGGRGSVYVYSLCPLVKTSKIVSVVSSILLIFLFPSYIKGRSLPLCLSFGGHFEMLLQCVTKVNFFLVFYLQFIICAAMNFFLWILKYLFK